MTWTFDPKTRRADDEDGLIPRVKVEEAIHRLFQVGIRSRPQLVSILAALTRLSKKEAEFNVDMVCPKEAL